MATRGAIPALMFMATVGAFVPQSSIAQHAEPSLAVPEAPPAPIADSLVAIDQALAGGRLVEAKDLLDRLEAEGNDRDPRLTLLRAEWLIAVGRAADALPLLAVIDSDLPTRCRVVAATTMALLDTAALDDADLLLASEEQPCSGEPVYWRGLGRLHLARVRPAEAVAALRRAAALEPTNDEIQGELAVALLALGDAGDAVQLLAALARRDPARADIRINLDYAHGMLGQRPSRAASDDDMFWSRRLQYAGLGARRADRARLAEAMLGQAILVRPRHDAELWRQYEEVSVTGAKGPTLVSN